ncbi:hypothetical protein Nans01_44650 [Nocardiopsis ansamitocini]|uniref:Uncharacterized protein n=1 Tax=Nocardiopsis ansamitocini TaxID=1670832 RepID=A0A9W6P9J7_9ACTN|nr:hypothetical protein Nans01_44650 [Nocardiopsis ansamitocini]
MGPQLFGDGLCVFLETIGFFALAMLMAFSPFPDGAGRLDRANVVRNVIDHVQKPAIRGRTAPVVDECLGATGSKAVWFRS